MTQDSVRFGTATLGSNDAGVSVGRDTKVCRVCRINLATLKVAINYSASSTWLMRLRPFLQFTNNGVDFDLTFEEMAGAFSCSQFPARCKSVHAVRGAPIPTDRDTDGEDVHACAWVSVQSKSKQHVPSTEVSLPPEPGVVTLTPNLHIPCCATRGPLIAKQVRSRHTTL